MRTNLLEPAVSGSRPTNPVLLSWKLLCDLCKDIHLYLRKPSFGASKLDSLMQECMITIGNYYVEPPKKAETETRQDECQKKNS